MSRLTRIAGTILAAALASGPGLADAQLTDLALTGEAATQPGLVFWEFGDPKVDNAGTALVFAKTRTPTPPVTRRDCLVTITSAGVADEVACVRDASPADGRAFQVFKELAVNGAGDAAFSAALRGSLKGIFRWSAGTLSSVALKGTVGAGGTIEELFDPTITAAGDVVFRADLAGVADTLDQAIFKCSGDCTGGGLNTLVQKKDAVPDRADRIFCGFTEVTARDWGIAFVATTRRVAAVGPADCGTATDTRSGVFRRPTGGSVVTLALTGEPANPAPGLGGATYAGFKGRPSIEDDGVVAFLAGLGGLLITSNIYLCDPAGCPAAPAAVAVPSGVSVDGQRLTRFTAPVVADSGDLTFGGGSGGRSCGVFIRRASGDIETVAFRGDDVPGTAGPLAFECFGPPDFSPGGDLAFTGAFRRPVVPRHGAGVFLLPD